MRLSLYYLCVSDKTYTNEIEEDRRRQIFADNLLYIQQHNRKYELGQSSFYLGVNEYTDLVSSFLSLIRYVEHGLKTNC